MKFAIREPFNNYNYDAITEIERLANRIVSDWLFVKHGYFSKPIDFKE